MQTSTYESIKIISAADDAYAMPLGVMLVSLLGHVAAEHSIAIYILEGEQAMKEDNKEKLRAIIAQRANTSIHFLPVRATAYQSFNVNIDYINLVTYYRFSIDQLLPEDIDRVLYLDCDMLIQDDILQLWNTDLQGNIIGAVEDGAFINNPTAWSTNLKRKMRLAPTDKYLNAGVLLIDLKKWRAAQVSEKCIQHLTAYPEQITLNDQDALNFILKDQWLPLPIQWNLTTFLVTESHLFTGREVRKAIAHPSIIHFTTGNKPWLTNKVHPFAEVFVKYWKKTPWYVPHPIEGNHIINEGVALVTYCFDPIPLKKSIQSWLDVDWLKEIVLLMPADAEEVLAVIQSYDDPRIVVVQVQSEQPEALPAFYNLGVQMTTYDKVLKLPADFQVYSDFLNQHPLSLQAYYGFWKWRYWFEEKDYVATGFLVNRQEFLDLNGLNEQLPLLESHLDFFERMRLKGFKDHCLDANFIYSLGQYTPIADYQPIPGLEASSDADKIILLKSMANLATESIPWSLTTPMAKCQIVTRADGLHEASFTEIPVLSDQALTELRAHAIIDYIRNYIPASAYETKWRFILENKDFPALVDLYHFCQEPQNALLIFSSAAGSFYRKESTPNAEQKLEAMKSSLSWRIGYQVTRWIKQLVGWTPWFKKRFPNG